MKWVVFALALAAVYPAADWLRRNPKHLTKAWLLFGFLPFAYNPHISPIDWAGWPGYVKGIQITGLDLLAVILYLNLPRPTRPAPFRFVAGFYFLAIALSVFQAQVPMAAVFYPWQLLRVFFVFLVVRRTTGDGRAVQSIVAGMTVALCFEATLAIWQRFGQGILQVPGSLGDKNLLGLASEFAIFTPFALMLAGKRSWQTALAPIAGVIVAVLTTSRAAVGLGALGLVITFIMSALRRWTARKASVLFTGIIFVALMSPVALYSFQKRFSEDPLALEYNERAAFNKAASLILSEHPFGIGANNYVVTANGQGYLTRAKVPWGGSQRDAIVHNLFWLTAAESGYLGVMALVLLWARITWVAFRASWQNRHDPRGDLLLGLGITLVIVAIHNEYEWVFMLYPVQYLFAITTGLVAGLAEQLGYWRIPAEAGRHTFHQPLRVRPEGK